MKYLLTIINLLIIGLIYAQTPNNDLNWAPFWIDNFLISANPSLSLRRVPQGRAVAAWGACWAVARPPKARFAYGSAQVPHGIIALLLVSVFAGDSAQGRKTRSFPIRWET